MKKLLVFIVMVLFVVNTYADDKKKQVCEVTYNVAMDCQSCANKITKNIPFEKGVKDLNVNMDEQTVTVKYRADKTTNENLVKAFDKLGFKAVDAKSGDQHTHSKKACCSGCSGHKH